MERVGGRGLVAQQVAVRALQATAGARDAAAGRDEAPRVDARPDRRRAGAGDDADLQAARLGAPQSGVGVQRVGERLFIRVLHVLAERQVQSWNRETKRAL